MVEPLDDDFERMAAEELGPLPDRMVRGLVNVRIPQRPMPAGGGSRAGVILFDPDLQRLALAR